MVVKKYFISVNYEFSFTANRNMTFQIRVVNPSIETICKNKNYQCKGYFHEVISLLQMRIHESGS